MGCLKTLILFLTRVLLITLVPELRALTGQDEEVRDYLSIQPEVGRYKLQISFLFSWLPLLERTDRSYLTIVLVVPAAAPLFISQSI